MSRIIFILFLMLTLLKAQEYPKFFSQLGTPLYKADQAFSRLSHLINDKEALQGYHDQVKFLLHLSKNINADKSKRKIYIQGLRLLEKKQEEVLISLNAVLLHSIDNDNYETFKQIMNEDIDAILNIPVIRKRAMAYYGAHRTRGIISSLENIYHNIKQDPSLHEYIKGHLPPKHLITQGYDISYYPMHTSALSSNERLAYIAAQKGCLKILNIKNFQKVSHAYTFEYTLEGCELMDLSLSKDHNYAYLSDQKNGFSIININHTDALFVTGEFPRIKAKHALINHDDTTAFIIHKNHGFSILDISNKLKPKLLSNYNHGLKISDLALDEQHGILYVTHQQGMRLLDVSILGNPRKIYEYTLEKEAHNIVLSPKRRLAYLSLKEEGVHVLDISKPETVSFISRYQTPKEAYHLTLSSDENELFITAGDDGVYHVNTQDENDLRAVITYKRTNTENSTPIALSTTLNTANTHLFINYKNAGLAKVELKK